MKKKRELPESRVRTNNINYIRDEPWRRGETHKIILTLPGILLFIFKLFIPVRAIKVLEMLVLTNLR